MERPGFLSRHRSCRRHRRDLGVGEFPRSYIRASRMPAAYAARPQTRREQLDGLREAFGFRMFAPGRGRDMLAWLLPVALATTSAITVAAALMDELRRRRIVAPGPSVVERLVAATLVVAERHVAGQLGVR